MPVTPFHRLGKLVTGSAAADLLALGLVAGALQFSSPANARSASVSCNDAVTSAPTGRATVSAASTRYGKVLVVGSGDHAGCSLYVLTSDAFHALHAAPRSRVATTTTPSALRATAFSGRRCSRTVPRSPGRGSTPRSSEP